MESGVVSFDGAIGTKQLLSFSTPLPVPGKGDA